MILEEATKEAFGYYASELTTKSHKHIIAVCELCGEFKLTTKNGYRTFCHLCSQLFGEKLKDKVFTEEHKANMCKNHADVKGEKNPMFGMSGEKNPNFGRCGVKHPMFNKHHTEETRTLMCKNHADARGEKSPNWRGGISFEPYCKKFNEEFKEYIRLKFGYKCFLCPTTQAENGQKLSVHHVSYNKNCGCDGDKTCNFVPLCRSCHIGTNHNRDYWKKLITDKLHNTIIGWGV